jgi:DNA-binding GntR family transcriptional regulator
MRIWRLFVDRLPDIDAHIDQHRGLIEAIVVGDANRARDLARAHVRSFESAVRALL